MNSSGEIAQDLLPAGGLTERDGVTAIGDRFDFVDDTKRDDIGCVAGIVDACERGKNILWS